MHARDIMSRHVMTVRSEMTLQEVAKFFDENHISGAPVVDDQGTVVGVISQTDLVRHEREGSNGGEKTSHFYGEFTHNPNLPKGFHIESPDLTRVREVMSPMVISAEQGASVEELARLMLHNGVHRIVITKDGKLKGIVTSMDILRALPELLGKKERSISSTQD